MNNYRYTLKTTGASSHKYGPCGVCGEHASEVFSQAEQRAYDLPGTLEDRLEDPAFYIGGIPGWTYLGCHWIYGHKACLLGKQR